MKQIFKFISVFIRFPVSFCHFMQQIQSPLSFKPYILFPNPAARKTPAHQPRRRLRIRHLIINLNHLSSLRFRQTFFGRFLLL